jgi:hypothetical protein
MKALIIIFVLNIFCVSLIAQTRYYPKKPDHITQGSFDYYKNMLDDAYEKNNLYGVGVALANMGESKELVYKILNQAVEEKPQNCYMVHSFNNLLLKRDFKTTLTKLSIEDWQKLCTKCLISMDSTEYNRIYEEQVQVNKKLTKGFYTLDSSKLNVELMAQLADIMKKDQVYRNQLAWATPEQSKELWKQINETDAQNLKDIEAIIDKYGFPVKSLVGDKCEVAIFVLHHQPDIKVHEKYLPIIEELVKKGELHQGSLNMFKVRIDLHNAGQKK